MTDDIGGTIEVESLVPSRLGTQAYWDDNYGRELSNFCEAGDEGEVWFGEASSDEILDWIARYLPSPMTPTKLSFFSAGTEDGQLPGPLTHARTDSQILDGTPSSSLSRSFTIYKFTNQIGVD
jgi:hypothetical protein